MTHPGTPRDVDLDAWRQKFAFHPADTRAKQLGHQLVRKAVMALGDLLHWVVPASDDKSVMFRLLGDVLMLANRSLAVQGGPPLVGNGGEEYLEIVLLAALRNYEATQLPEDPRIREYEAEQRGEPKGYESPFKTHGHDGEHFDLKNGDALGVTGGVRVQAPEGAIHDEADTEAPETFRAEFEDGDVKLNVVGGRGYVALGTTADNYPPQSDVDGRYGWYANLTTPTAVNQLLSAVAAAGDRAFTA